MVLNTARVFSAITLCIVTTAMAQAPTKPATATATAPAVSTTKAAAGNSSHAGKVWGNLDSKIYHCEGDRYWGTTKNGNYMTLAEAKAKGMTAAKNSKNCKE